ncbi:unnamed protein product, partial [Symbiodinium natans]
MVLPPGLDISFSAHVTTELQKWNLWLVPQCFLQSVAAMDCWRRSEEHLDLLEGKGQNTKCAKCKGKGVFERVSECRRCDALGIWRCDRCAKREELKGAKG